jgi:pimeloyl-ACP methyl ester carboxylesterase
MERNNMLTVTSKDTTIIAYDKLGQGPLVILVGGAFNTRTFGPNASLAPLLAKDFTVINYDRRGRGESTDTLPYTSEREIEDIEALINEHGGKAYLYGISSGAALALDAAEHISNKIEKIAIFEAPYVVDSSRSPVPIDFTEQLTTMIKLNNRSGAIKYFMTKGVGLPSIFVAMMRLMPSWKQLKAVANTAPYDAAYLRSNSLGKPLNPKQWAHITMPTLVIVGGKSPTWMKNGMKNLADVLPNAKHYVLEGQMHIVQAPAIMPILNNFFKEK